MVECLLLDDCELVGEGYALEGGTPIKHTRADSFEVFVADDVFEGGAVDERQLFYFFEHIGESDTGEGRAMLECPLSYIRNVAVLTEYHTHEMLAARECKLWNARKFGTTGEVDLQEGRAQA